MNQNAINEQRATSNEQRIILSSKGKEDEISTLNRKIQLVELDIFKTFRDICQKHNLRYFAIGGTCIGAIRHHGFIPWDDDMDIAMPYEDYKKFFEIAKTELPDYYAVKTPYSCRGLSYFSKIHNINTTFVESSDINNKESYGGIFIDIFPITGMPKGKIRQFMLVSVLRKLRGCNKVIRMGDNETIKKKLFILFTKIFRYNPSYYHFSEKIENMLKKYPFGSSEKVLFPWRPLPGDMPQKYYKGIFFYEDFKSVIEVPFEDTTMSVPVGYDRYLTMDFGNYMELPPEEDRVTSHSQGSIIDLERPYKEYQDKIYKIPENK